MTVLVSGWGAVETYQAALERGSAHRRRRLQGVGDISRTPPFTFYKCVIVTHQKPNLFHYATSELSQDALLAWLLAWADRRSVQHDAAMHALGKKLLGRLLAIGGVESPEEAVELTVHRQYKRADLVLEVHDGPVVLIEDKTFTKEHSGQLKRYLTDVQAVFPQRRVIPLYLKIGEQGSYAAVDTAGYCRVTREVLLDVLGEATELRARNTILDDYVAYLGWLDDQINSFKTQPLVDWQDKNAGWWAWQGFFVELQKHLQAADWSYVANPAGGFLGLWWKFLPVGGRCVYLQLEDNVLCFKLEVEDKARQSTERNAWHQHLMALSKGSKLGLRRPRRFGKGRWMTAVQLAGDYRRPAPDGCLDFEATLGVLQEAEKLLDQAAKEFTDWPRAE
jgi:hypothetical protein